MRNFQSNSLLKACKYSLSGSLCLTLAILVPFVHTHPWMFMFSGASAQCMNVVPFLAWFPLFSDVVGGLAADTVVGFIGCVDPADGRGE